MKIYQINNIVTIKYSQSHDSRIKGPNAWFIVDDDLYNKYNDEIIYQSSQWFDATQFKSDVAKYGFSDILKLPIITVPNIPKYPLYGCDVPQDICNYNPKMEVVPIPNGKNVIVVGLDDSRAYVECDFDDGIPSEYTHFYDVYLMMSELSGFFKYICGISISNPVGTNDTQWWPGMYGYSPYEIHIAVLPTSSFVNGKFVSGGKFKSLTIRARPHTYIGMSGESTIPGSVLNLTSSEQPSDISEFNPNNPSGGGGGGDGENPNNNYTPNTENVGGSGSFDYSSDNNPFTLNKDIKLAGNSGFVKIYVPTDEQLQTIGSRMRDEDLFSTVATYFAGDISKAVIALNILPLDVPNDNTEHNLKIGWTNITASAPYATKQWIAFDCGTVEIPSFTKTEFDYSPNTQIQIYLPYVGVRDLDIDVVVGRKLNLIYNCDIVSGACIAVLEDNETHRVYYQYTGNMAINVPITSRDFTNVFQSLIQTTTNVTVGAITGGGIGGVIGGAVGGAVGLLNTKPQISHNGNVNTNYGYMSSAIPYVEIKTPSLSIASDENQYKGFPTNQTVTLSDCQGFTKVEEIHVENISATSNEQNEIVNLLTEGVII